MMAVDLAEATRLYDQAMALVKKNFLQAQEEGTVDAKETTEFVWRLVEHITLGDRGLIYFTNRATPQNHLIAQSINSCILSLIVGADLGYDTFELNELGIGALLHDVGMVKFPKVGAPRKLTQEELEEIRQHPQQGVEILKKSGLSDTVIFICREYHRRNWENDPFTTQEERLREFAQIVGLIDIYVAMTQPRPYRDGKLCFEAMRELIDESSEIFDSRVIKTLVNEIGIYPIGSWVRLNTREVARVVGQNKNFPLHPVVEIVFDSRGHFLEEPKRHDLYRQKIIYVKEPLDYRNVKLFESGKTEGEEL